MAGGLTIFTATEKVQGFFCHATSMVVRNSNRCFRDFFRIIGCIVEILALFSEFVNDFYLFGFFQSFELLVRDGSLWPLRMLKTHRSVRTLFFMILSGILMDSMYLNSDSIIWLFKPNRKYKVENDVSSNETKSFDQHHICNHKKNCKSHILQVCKYK